MERCEKQVKEELHSFICSEENPSFFAELIGISYCDGSYRIQRHNSSLHILEYVVEGTGTIITGGRTYTASKGDVYILEPGNHEYFSDPDWPWTKLFLNTNGSLVSALMQVYGLQGHVVFSNCPAEPLMREVIELTRKATSQTCLMESLALKVHELLLLVAHTFTQDKPHSEEAVLLKAMVDESMHQRLSIDSLAKAIYRSPDYVIKLFKKEFGQTPYAYSTRRKIMAAQQLLRESRMPINEIASLLAYPDAQYFSNLFRRHTGYSPSDFRRKG